MTTPRCGARPIATLLIVDRSGNRRSISIGLLGACLTTSAPSPVYGLVPWTPSRPPSCSPWTCSTPAPARSRSATSSATSAGCAPSPPACPCGACSAAGIVRPRPGPDDGAYVAAVQVRATKVRARCADSSIDELACDVSRSTNPSTNDGNPSMFASIDDVAIGRELRKTYRSSPTPTTPGRP